MHDGGSISGSSLLTVSQTVGSTPVGEDDGELLRVCCEFQVVDAELDRLTALETDPPETELLALHRRWSVACLLCSRLEAHSAEGQQAKAKVLLSAIRVAFGGNFEDALPHELLALSLAQDLVVRGCDKVTCRP